MLFRGSVDRGVLLCAGPWGGGDVDPKREYLSMAGSILGVEGEDFGRAESRFW